MTTTNRIEIKVEQYDTLEWVIEINGRMWAAGNCTDWADGQRQARAELARAGITVENAAERYAFQPL